MSCYIYCFKALVTLQKPMEYLKNIVCKLVLKVLLT